MKPWKASKDPEYQVKQARVEHLYAIADGEFGPLDLMPGRAAGPPILPAPLTTMGMKSPVDYEQALTAGTAA